MTAKAVMEAARPLRVCLLHNYRERQQMSMKLYAEKLGDALAGQGVEVERVRVPDVLPESWQRWPIASKVDSYVGRFAVYPLVARRQRADVFHIMDHGQAYLLAHLDPARTVVTCHDVMLLALAAGRMSSPDPPRFATHVLRYVAGFLRRARAIVAVSEQTKRDLVSLVGVASEKVRVIYSGLDARFRPAPELGVEARRRWKLGTGPLVLHVGQTGFYKNIEGCLRVVAKVRQAGIKVTFVRVGQPLRPSQLGLAQELWLNGAVRELGLLGEEDLVALYNAADMLLFPSLYEGFGWPPLEAMACGTPVVCSREGSLPEAVGDAALTAPRDDVDALAAHVAAVALTRGLADNLARRGIERASLFNWHRTAAGVQRVYEQLLEN